MDIAKLLLDDMGGGMGGGVSGGMSGGGMSGGNASSSVSAYEGLATRKTPAQMLARRYGCDRKGDHHSRARCMLQGKLDQLKLMLQRSTDPRERFKIQMRIATWKEKMSNELRRNRFRAD